MPFKAYAYKSLQSSLSYLVKIQFTRTWLHLWKNCKLVGKNGFNVTTSNGIIINVKVAISVACDIPASRKVCGFLSHNASLGCNKCYKNFSDNNCSVLSDASSSLRNKQLHLEHLDEFYDAKTKSDMKRIEKKYGVRFSVLTTLSYFNPLRLRLLMQCIIFILAHQNTCSSCG